MEEVMGSSLPEGRLLRRRHPANLAPSGAFQLPIVKDGQEVGMTRISAEQEALVMADELGSLRRRRERRAREQILLRSLPLVYGVAGRYRDSGLPYPELVRVASLGLLRAAERYDGRGGQPFGTFAVRAMSAELDAHTVEARLAAVLAERRRREGAAAERAIAGCLSRQDHLRELSGALGLDAEIVAAGLLEAAAREEVPLLRSDDREAIALRRDSAAA
jgi:DNA-directed RNA polymerase specialized sigma subunit